ncbi:hypothetical protein ABZ942_41180 [Nocardia sp. NPDC046473]
MGGGLDVAARISSSASPCAPPSKSITAEASDRTIALALNLI